jgi:hypothetical protein
MRQEEIEILILIIDASKKISSRNQLVNCNYEKKSNLSICYPLKSSGPCSKKNKKNFKKSVADPKRVYIFAPRN